MLLEPAASIIKELGGVPAVSEYLGVDPTTVRRFSYPKSKFGTGGFIPIVHIYPLHLLSRRNGNPIPLARFILTPDQRQELGALDAEPPEVLQSASDASLNKNGKIIP